MILSKMSFHILKRRGKLTYNLNFLVLLVFKDFQITTIQILDSTF